MNHLSLTVDLLPRGAWGNNLSKTLPKKDWDTLRAFCCEKANHRCAICGNSDGPLSAHEVWDFDPASQTQTLSDIIALCAACHGVKHLRNSERLGYGENAKAHFLKINRCSPMDFAKHCTEARMRFEALNRVMRWRRIADLGRFGGDGIEVRQRHIPKIISPYEGVDWDTVRHIKKANLLLDTSERYPVVLYPSEAMYFSIRNQATPYVLPPRIHSIVVDNYQGTIQVVAGSINKIEWTLDGKHIKTKYNVRGRFMATFCVEALEGLYLGFKLVGKGGETSTLPFELVPTSLQGEQ